MNTSKICESHISCLEAFFAPQFDWSLLFPPKVIVGARVVTLDISGPVAARMQRAPVHVLLQNKNGGTGRREKLVN